MAIIGLESVVYGVDDLDRCARFWSDFGLAPVARTAGRAVFETREGTTIELRRADDPDLPAAPVAGPTAREIVWGVSDSAALEDQARRLARACEVRRSADGAVHGIDPCGYGFAFRLTQRRKLAGEATAFNRPGAPARIDRPATLYAQARPSHLAHAVVLCPELERMRDFYIDAVGFRLTDSYPGFSYFLRCPDANDHHNLYLLKRGAATGFHHVAFDLRDIHELFGGGLAMQAKGWKTHLGPGRHPISSAYFWYFSAPCGGAAEYDFDADVLTDAWTPRELVPSPQLFAEWALEAGFERYEGEQKTHIAAPE